MHCGIDESILNSLMCNFLTSYTNHISKSGESKKRSLNLLFSHKPFCKANPELWLAKLVVAHGALLVTKKDKELFWQP